MAFFDAELAQPYKQLFYDYPSEDARLDQDAANRARQFAAQGAAARGGGASPRGAATNTYNRLLSDYTLNKAQTDRQNRLQYTNTMNALMRSPGAVTPSTASTLAGVGGTIGGAVLKEAAPDIWKKAKGLLGWNQTPEQGVAQYNNLSLYDTATPQTMTDLSGAYQPDFSGAYSGLMDYSAFPDYAAGGSVTPAFNEGFGGYNYGDMPYGDLIGSTPSFVDTLPADEIANLFDTGFIGW